MTIPGNRKGSYREANGRIERRCGSCKAWKPHDADHFHRNGNRPTGLQAHCKTCQRDACKPASARRWLRHKAKINAQAAQIVADYRRKGKAADKPKTPEKAESGDSDGVPNPRPDGLDIGT